MSTIQLQRTDLKEFECPICSECYKKVIFQCSTGHSICEECSKRMSNCPFCQQNIKTTRNYALETVVQKIVVVCENDGCPSTLTICDYADHVKNCAHRTPPCLMCNATNYANINEHIRAAHKRLVVINRSILVPHQYTICCVDCDTKMFWVKRFIDDGYVYWYAQATTRISEKYYLIVRALMPDGSDQGVVFPCIKDPTLVVNVKNKILVGFKTNGLNVCRFHLYITKLT